VVIEKADHRNQCAATDQRNCDGGRQQTELRRRRNAQQVGDREGESTASRRRLRVRASLVRHIEESMQCIATD
jgi:hypothetical protein